MPGKRKMSWASTCPVTRRQHDWIKIKSMGADDSAFCGDCYADWIGLDKEWEIYDRVIQEYVEASDGRIWARFK